MKFRDDFRIYSKYLDFHFNDQPASFLKFRQDTELSHIEKVLLNARLQIRDKQWDECFEKLESAKTEVPFFKAERYLQMANIELLRSRYESSIQFGQLAIRFFQECDDSIGLFRAHFNMMAAFQRAGLNTLARFYLIQSEKFAINEKEQLIIARAKSSFFSNICDFDSAISTIEEIFAKKDRHNKLEFEFFIVSAADIYFRAGKYKRALELITSILNSKVLLVRGRVLFLYHTFKLLIENKELPTKPQAVEQIPEFNLKWDILETIKSGEADRSKELWASLVQMFPTKFEHSFSSQDESESLASFMKSVQALLVKKPECKVDVAAIKGKKARLLIEVLMNSNTPIRKEILIERVWQTTYQPELDARFYKLIERVKGLTQLTIKNDSSAYYLAKA